MGSLGASDLVVELPGALATRAQVAVTADMATLGCTHVATKGTLKRVAKVAIAVSMPSAIFVKGREWLLACESAKTFVPAKPYELPSFHSSPPEAPGLPWTLDIAAARDSIRDKGPCLAGHRWRTRSLGMPARCGHAL